MKKNFTLEELKKYVDWQDGEIPIVIGVSAHRNPADGSEPFIKERVKAVIEEIKSICPHSPIVIMTALAQGGDIICAEVGQEMGVNIAQILPFEESIFFNSEDFTPEWMERYRKVKEKIKEQSIFNEPFIAPDVEGKEILDLQSKRRYLFRQQTIFVATHCHFLLSLWNGETQNESFDKISGAMLGCGAFNAVQFALKNNYNHWYDSEFGVDSQCFVCWIKTPRQGEKYNKCDVKTTFLHTADNNGFYNEFKIMGITSVEQSDKLPENLLEILVKTNLYNEDYYKYCKDEEKKQRKNFINWLKRVKKSIKSIFKKKNKDQKKESSPDDKYLIGKVEYENGGERLKRIHDCCKISSNLSQKEKKSFFTSVKLLGLCGFIFLILLLFYDQIYSLAVFVFCFVAMFFILWIYPIIKNKRVDIRKRFKKEERDKYDEHSKFIEYRALSESLRVQYYLTAYAQDKIVTEFFSWSHKCEISWIVKAVKVLLIGKEVKLWDIPSVQTAYSKITVKCINYGGGVAGTLEKFEDKLFRKWIGSSKYWADYNHNGQIGYHLKNIEKQKRRIKKRDKVNGFVAKGTVVLYSILFILEIISILSGYPDLSVNLFWQITIRGLFKGLIAIMAATTFYASYYYDKLSMDRNLNDSQNICTLYVSAYDKVDEIFSISSNSTINQIYANKTVQVKRAEFQKIIDELAREEILENGMWIAYNRENDVQMPF